MREKGFSVKQIDKLKKLSEKYSTSLNNTIFELARRFPRSLFLHIIVFFITLHAYIRFSKQHGYISWHIIFFIGILCITYIIFDLFAPLFQGYKARKVIKKIKTIENPIVYK